MSDQYLSSDKVLKAYPTSMRATEYDPESALLTESNLTYAVRALLKSKKSFIISWNSDTSIAEFVLKGYYFKVNLSGVWAGSGDFGVKLQEASRALSVSVGAQSYKFTTDVMGESGSSNLDDSKRFKGFAYTADETDATVDLWLFKDGSLNEADAFRFDTEDIQDKGSANPIAEVLTTDTAHVAKITSKDEEANVVLGNTIVPEGSVALGASDNKFSQLYVGTANAETINASESVTVGDNTHPLDDYTRLTAGSITVNSGLFTTTIDNSGVSVGTGKSGTTIDINGVSVETGKSRTTIDNDGVTGTIVGLNTELYEHNIVLTSDDNYLYLKFIDNQYSKYDAVSDLADKIKTYGWQALIGHLDVSDAESMKEVTADPYYSVGIYCTAERVYYSESTGALQASFIAAWWNSIGNWPKVQQCAIDLSGWTITDTLREIVIKK